MAYADIPPGKLEALPPDLNEPPQRWECYECGNLSGEGVNRFMGHRDWETGIQDDVECLECGSCDTGPEGEGYLSKKDEEE